MVRILLVEDDATVREAVAAHLTRSGHDVQVSGDGPAALTAYLGSAADLVLLDLMLPMMGGCGDQPGCRHCGPRRHRPALEARDWRVLRRSEVSRRLRSIRPDLPIIMLTARSQEHERVQGLQHGADDYVTKPFSMRELELRIRSVLRRVGSPQRPVTERLVDGDLILDLAARSTRLGGRPLALTAREFDLLAWLLRHPGEVWSRDDLIRDVWGWDVGDQSTVTVHVRRLREKVEDDPSSPTRLVTVFGRGYRWDPLPPVGP